MVGERRGVGFAHESSLRLVGVLCAPVFIGDADARYR